MGLPADLNELQNEVPLTSVSQPDHTSCNGGNYAEAGLEVFPEPYQHVKSKALEYDKVIAHITRKQT